MPAASANCMSTCMELGAWLRMVLRDLWWTSFGFSARCRQGRALSASLLRLQRCRAIRAVMVVAIAPI